MLAVLSTLSGTIALKQYFSNGTGLRCSFNASRPRAVCRQAAQTPGLICASTLSGGPAVSPRLTDLVKLAQECCYHSNLPVAAYGVIVLSNITVSCPDKGSFCPRQVADGFHSQRGFFVCFAFRRSELLSRVISLRQDMAQLEQDTVMGVQSLLMLCSQDSSKSAQATLKVGCSGEAVRFSGGFVFFSAKLKQS